MVSQPRSILSYGHQASMKKCLLAILLLPLSVFAQSDAGELRLKVSDPTGFGVQCTVELASEANQFRQVYSTDEVGGLIAKRLPFGFYRMQVLRNGFAPYTKLIEIRSAVPAEYAIRLSLATLSTSVTVNDQETLVDPARVGTINRIGEDTVENRLTSLPGRSLQELVNSQPGWLYEGNAVLHPRGSEYQTQFVVDGVPFTDNRSPGFAPELEADDVQSVSIYTASFPAEYGRKMGGVVEVAGKKDPRPGFHGEASLSGGSFDTAGAHVLAQYASGNNLFGFSADGDFTGRYLNPPVVQNFTNAANSSGFSAQFERDLSPQDHLNLIVRHQLARFEIPNEQVQQLAGQSQHGAETETSGIGSYQHIFSPNFLGTIAVMARDDADTLDSNQFSTPIIAEQNRGFREGYFKGTVAVHHGRQEWKAGVEADFYNLHEQFGDVITDPTQFDPGTPPAFDFFGRGYDREQAAFVQDFVRMGSWSLSAGLRWDHYHLLVDKNAISPRLGVARYFQSADLVLHASYDRIFQTPAFENILLSSSPAVISLSPTVLREPVQPSLGNYYEVGVTKGFFGAFKLDVNYFVRRANNFADDNQLLNTPVSFPIAFSKANIYGAEGKIDLPRWKRLSGYVSYSYMVGSVYFPVTGGLFLGQAATDERTTLSGRFWDSQDQRNTVRTRFRYQILPRLWAAAGALYGSGLPVDFDGSEQQALAAYGPLIIQRVNFERGRIRPAFSVDVSAGAEVYKKDKVTMRLQADGQNLNNRLNLIDFAGLFSGNSVAPPRSYALRFSTSF